MLEIFRLTAVTKFSAGVCAISVPELFASVAAQRFHWTALEKLIIAQQFVFKIRSVI